MSRLILAILPTVLWGVIPPELVPVPMAPDWSESRQDRDPLISQRTRGDRSAPIKIYEVTDFACPYCRTFSVQVLPDLIREYIDTGKAQLIFVNLPLIDLHENAAAAHEFAMCAAKQDQFWPIHDLLFRYQSSWDSRVDPSEYFLSLADSASLDRVQLSECLDTGAVRWLVMVEAEAVAKKGIRSTPSFLVEDGVIPGVHPIEVWRPILDSIFVAKTGGAKYR